MTENDYIAKRRAATKRLNAEIRAMPEFAAAVVETEAYIYAEGELSLEATCSKMKRVQIEVLPGTLGGRIALATDPTGTTSICGSILLNGVPEVNGRTKEFS